jgi:uncharacterized iron-regulated membrane protein
MFDVLRDLIMGLIVGWAASMLALLAGASLIVINVVGLVTWAIAFVVAVLARRERRRREVDRASAVLVPLPG